jgi:SAM-dependent methyltransferase
MGDPSAAPIGRVAAGLALLCAAVLVFQVALTRIFSFVTWYHLTFLAISIALLGFGAAGTYLAIRRGGADSRGLASASAALFALTVPLALLAIARVPPELLRIDQDPREILKFIVVVVTACAPFFFAGLAISALLSGFAAQAARLYAADLSASAIGCLCAVFLINSGGGIRAALAAAAMAALGGIVLAPPAAGGLPRLALANLAAALVAVTPVILPGEPFALLPSATKELGGLLRRFAGQPLIEYSAWNMVARVDITRAAYTRLPSGGGALAARYAARQWPVRGVFQDGAAPTQIFWSDGNIGRMDFLDGYLQATPYQLVEKPRVLVIGVGGGLDVLIALGHGAAHVTGVDINPVTVGAVQRVFGDFTGGVFRDSERVRLRAAEGRHFVSASRDVYDVIQMSGVDTFAALSAGAYTMSENHLYTKEAIRHFLARLSPSGVLSFSRWEFEPPRETLRLAATVVEALEDMGVSEPHRHVLVVRGPLWADLAVSKTALQPADLARVGAWVSQNGFSVLFDPFHRTATPYDAVLRAPRAERRAFYAAYPFDIAPSTDDRPFFFDYYKWSSLLKSDLGSGGYGITQLPVGLRVLIVTLVVTAVLGMAAILLPLRRRALPGGDAGRTLGYFACLGFGFMFVEIALLQRFVFYLGGPAYSLTTVLFALLLFAGLGSLASARRAARGPVAVAGLGLAVALYCLALAFLSGRVIEATLALSPAARRALFVGITAPLAFMLGHFFPLGISALRLRDPAWVAWAWGVNGFCTVLASVLAVLVALHAGFSALFVLAAGCYLPALLLFPRPSPSPPPAA